MWACPPSLPHWSVSNTHSHRIDQANAMPLVRRPSMCCVPIFVPVCVRERERGFLPQNGRRILGSIQLKDSFHWLSKLFPSAIGGLEQVFLAWAQAQSGPRIGIACYCFNQFKNPYLWAPNKCNRLMCPQSGEWLRVGLRLGCPFPPLRSSVVFWPQHSSSHHIKRSSGVWLRDYHFQTWIIWQV